MDPPTVRRDGVSVRPCSASNVETLANLDSTTSNEDDRSTENGASTDDEEQEWVSPSLIKAVKIAVYHLLYRILNRYITDCNGCKTNHPSQKQHDCLKLLDDHFYADHYYSIRNKLITARFIPSIQRFLFDRDIDASDATVGIVADTLLYELQSHTKILDALSEAYMKLVGDNVVKHGQLGIVTQVYESNRGSR